MAKCKALTASAVKGLTLLPLKAARRDATKFFGSRGHQRPNFNGFIYIRYAALPYSVGISAIYLLPFGEVRLGSVYVY